MDILTFDGAATYAIAKKYTDKQIAENNKNIPTGALKLSGQVASIAELPQNNNKDGDVYIVGEESAADKAEYYWFENQWNYLGETPVDLSGYVQNSDIPTVMADYGIDSRTQIQEMETEIGERVGRKYYVDGEARGEVFNDGNGTAFGFFSHSEGNNTRAIGKASHAEGSNTMASGEYSHAEGLSGGDQFDGGQLTASGKAAHAEGITTRASGEAAHAEGTFSTASGKNSHAEGWRTVSASENQHVQGRFNIEDTANKYAFIIGNGKTLNSRSNAFAIDWQGNIYVNNSETGVNVNDLMPKSAIVKLNSMDEFNALTDKTADWYFIKEG